MVYPRKRWWQYGVVVLWAIVVLGACAPQAAPLSSDDLSQQRGINSMQYHTLMHDGRTREYLLHVPTQLPADAPLVFVLHGFTDDAASFREMTQMDAVADRYGFAVVYPRGTLDQDGQRFWQVGYDFHLHETVDDVGFLIALAHHLQQAYTLSARHTYMTGMSNGGDMSFVMACRASTVFRAVAPVVGTLMQRGLAQCTAAPPVPMLVFNGSADGTTLYAGDMENRDGWGAYLGTDEVVEVWRVRNGCTSLKREDLLNPTATDPRHVERYTGVGCQAPLQFYKIIGGGHDWPGKTDGLFLDASDLIGAFFNAQSQVP